MLSYLVPSGYGEDEFKEKQSRFIGQIWYTENESEALQRIKETREKHWDARHNVYAYIIKDGAVRYSDDGEPKGTGGLPVLEVLKRNGLSNVCCVVTRYFGGVLLGTGGLTRAYTKAAVIAVEAAGISEMRSWCRVKMCCSYAMYDKLRLETEAMGGRVTNTDFTDAVCLYVLVPQEDTQLFCDKIVDITSSNVEPEVLGLEILPGKIKK